MNEGIITDAPPADQVQAGPTIHIGLEGVHVEFPDGYWDNPAMELVLEDGNPMRMHAIRNVAMAIAAGLAKALEGRRPTSGLVGPDGRPV